MMKRPFGICWDMMSQISCCRFGLAWDGEAARKALVDEYGNTYLCVSSLETLMNPFRIRCCWN